MGQYVRLVGTLWEDDPHDLGRCWDGPTEGGYGWYELHPVDCMGRIELFAPTPPRSTARVIAACGAGDVEVPLSPPGPRPPGMVPRFEEVVRVNERTTRRFTTRPGSVVVDLDVGGRFWAYYRVYWGDSLPPPPPSRPRTCPTGEKCCEPVAGGCARCVPINRACP